MTTAHLGYSIFPGMQESDDEHLAGMRILMPTITPILIVKSVYRSVEWYQRQPDSYHGERNRAGISPRIMKTDAV